MARLEEYPKITAAAARVNAGMNQAEASKRLGISKSSLQNYESGKTEPSWELVQRMESVYAFPAAYITFRKNYGLNEVTNVG